MSQKSAKPKRLQARTLVVKKLVNTSGKVSPSSGKIESISNTFSTDSESLPTTPGTLEHDRFSDKMDDPNPPGPIDPMMRP